MIGSASCTTFYSPHSSQRRSKHGTRQRARCAGGGSMTHVAYVTCTAVAHRARYPGQCCGRVIYVADSRMEVKAIGHRKDADPDAIVKWCTCGQLYQIRRPVVDKVQSAA